MTQPAQMPAEMSESHLRVWHEPNYPHAPLLRGFDGPAGGLVISSLPRPGSTSGSRRLSGRRDEDVLLRGHGPEFYRSSVVTNSVTKGVTKALGGLS